MSSLGDRIVAEARRLAPLIRREPAGWQTPVTVQEWPPNTPTYSWKNAGWVNHCGLSVNTINHNCGLTMGVHFGNNAWTPTGHQWMSDHDRLVPLEDVQPGDSVYCSDSGSDTDITHIDIATGPMRDDGGIPVIGFNHDTSGQGRERIDWPGYAVAVGRPIEPATPTPDPPDLTPYGEIGKRWQGIGGPTSVVGNPVAPEAPFVAGTRVQRFERGAILFAPGLGAWELYGGIAASWYTGAAAKVGMPAGPETDMPNVPRGRWQRFARGYICWHPDHGAHTLQGAILMAYLAADATRRTRYGPLISDELDAKVSVFKAGRIAWQRDLGTWAT